MVKTKYEKRQTKRPAASGNGSFQIENLAIA